MSSGLSQKQLRLVRACAVAVMSVLFLATAAFAQNIQVSPAALSATVVKGQTTTLTLNLQKTGSEQHFWEPKTSVTWISLSPVYGSSNTITTEVDQVRVTINSSSMTVGTNSGLVYIMQSAPGISRFVSVPVTVTVAQTGTTPPPPPPPTTPPPPPASPPPASPPPPPASPPPAAPPPPPPSSLNSTITVFPASLSANVVKGQNTTLTLNLQKTGTTQHVWEPKTSVGWIGLSPAYGSANTITTELDQVRVTINSGGMSIGTNSGLVYVWESGPGISRLITVPVTVTVAQTGTTPPPPPPPIGGVTPPPSPPPSPTNGTATVTWAPNSEADLAGYKLYVGTSSGIYSRIVDVGKVTSYAISLPKGVTYFFSVTAYDNAGNESGHSAELSRSLF